MRPRTPSATMAISRALMRPDCPSALMQSPPTGASSSTLRKFAPRPGPLAHSLDYGLLPLFLSFLAGKDEALSQRHILMAKCRIGTFHRSRPQPCDDFAL